MTKDYRIEIKVKNNWLLKKIESQGYDSIADFARQHNLSQQIVGVFVNLKEPPIGANGNWRGVFLKIANALKCMPEDICPPQHLTESLKKSRAHVEVGRDELKLFLTGAAENVRTPIEHLVQQEGLETINDYLESLRPREEDIMRMRFGLSPYDREHTLQEVGKKYGVKSERIRQVEAKCLRMLRTPSKFKTRMGLEESISLRAVAESWGIHKRKYGKAERPHYVPKWKKEEQENA